MNFIHTLANSILTPEMGVKLRRNKIIKDNSQYKGLIQTNEKYRNIHDGERCFIIGNGPSLKNVNLSKLCNEYTITVNQSPRMENFKDIHTTYHLWVDERFFHLKQDNPNDMELLDVMRNVNTNDNKPTVFYKVPAYGMVKEFGLDKEQNISYIMDGYINTDTPNVDFPITEPVPIFSTCIHYAIIIAVYMGFKEIYLLGCDCTGIINTINARIENSRNFEYAYNISENERKRMIDQNKKSSLADEFEWYSNLFRTYGMLFQYCKQRGVTLMNATEGSILEEVPRIKLNDVLKK
jgi:hypothetical protein